MSSGATHMHAQTKIHAVVRGVASGCGRALNSVMVVVGDKFGLYKTGQYRADRAESGSPPVRSSSTRR